MGGVDRPVHVAYTSQGPGRRDAKVAKTLIRWPSRSISGRSCRAKQADDVVGVSATATPAALKRLFLLFAVPRCQK